MGFLPGYEVIGDVEAGRTAFVLHGIFGSGRSWRGFCSRFVERLPDWRFVLVHLRGHGGSHGAPGPHTLAACAQDLARLAGRKGLDPTVVLGHSLGGKVALVLLREQLLPLHQVWVLDAPPGAEPGGGREDSSGVARLMRLVRGIRLPVTRRAGVGSLLRRQGLPAPVAGWMATNLVRSREAGGWVWHFEPDILEELLEDYWREDLWPVVEHPPGGTQVHLVRARDSDRWGEADRARLESLPDGEEVQGHLLEGAGHWLHADNPQGLMALLSRHL